MILEECALDDMHHDFICAFKNLVDSQVSKESLYRVVLQVTIATVHLETIINDVEAFVSSKLLCHSAVHCVIRCVICNQSCTMANHKSRSFQVSSHLCELELNMLVVSDWRTELLPMFNVFSCRSNTCCCTTNRAARYVESSTVKARECNLESTSLLS